MTTYNHNRFIKASLLAASIFLAVSSVYATTIDVALTNPPLSGSAGSTLQFFGTLSNNASLEEFLNGANSSGDANLNIDTSPFLLDPMAAAPISLQPNGQPGAIATGIHLFDVTINPAAAPGLYTGLFEAIGGADGGNTTAQDILGSVTFSVQVTGSTASVPEPSSWELLVAAIALLAWRKSGTFRRTMRTRESTYIPRQASVLLVAVTANPSEVSDGHQLHKVKTKRAVVQTSVEEVLDVQGLKGCNCGRSDLLVIDYPSSQSARLT